MVGLRKACSLVLVAWVVFSPLMLSWHRALAHPHGLHTNGELNCGDLACSFPDCSEPEVRTIADCPYGNENSSALPAGTVSATADCGLSACNDGSSDSNHTCRICELLWHDDIVSIQWFSVPQTAQSVHAEPDAAPFFVWSAVPYSWSVRGPPSIT